MIARLGRFACCCTAVYVLSACAQGGATVQENPMTSEHAQLHPISWGMTLSQIQAWAIDRGADGPQLLVHHWTVLQNGSATGCFSCSFHAWSYYFVLRDGALSKIVPAALEGTAIQNAKRVNPQALVAIVTESQGLSVGAFEDRLEAADARAKWAESRREPLAILNLFPKRSRADVRAEECFELLYRRYRGDSVELGEPLVSMNQRFGPPRITILGDSGTQTLIYGQDGPVGQWAIPWLTVISDGQHVSSVFTTWTTEPSPDCSSH